MSSFALGKTAALETITIRVKDRDQMIAFYRDMIGFSLKREENALAIMGVKESSKEQIWLEESPRAYPHFGEIKKLANYTLTVPSVEELASIYCRLVKHDYPTNDLCFNEEEIQLTLVDPEENELTIQAKQTETGITSTTTFAEKGEENLVLTAEAKITGVHLNVPDAPVATTFFQEILGCGSDNFQLALTDTQGEQYLTSEDEILGLDFLKFNIEEADLLALEQQLVKHNQEFYIDQKKSILTIFDPIGVEWWFMREKTK